MKISATALLMLLVLCLPAMAHRGSGRAFNPPDNGGYGGGGISQGSSSR
jgi:hypothetical protein